MKAERKIIVAISAIVLIGLAVTVIVQAASIYIIKNDQELKFQSHISSAVYSLEEYKETGVRILNLISKMTSTEECIEEIEFLGQSIINENRELYFMYDIEL